MERNDKSGDSSDDSGDDESESQKFNSVGILKK